MKNTENKIIGGRLLFFGVLGIHLILLTSLKFTAWPEMSLWPYLMTKGWLPYRDIAIAHTPLALIDLAIFYKIFGAGIIQLKIFTWILILLSDVLVFYVTKKLWGRKIAFTALTAYVFWLTFYDGNGLWFDLYMGFLAFCSFYFVRKRKWFFGGVFWALAFLSKQTAVWFLLSIIFTVLDYRLKIANYRLISGILLKFTIGVLVIFVPFTIILAIFNILPDFWNWAVNFGILTLPKSQGQIQIPALRNILASLFPFLIFLPLFLNQKSKILNLFLWAFAGFLGAFPRFEYFHFQPAIPFLAIASALVFSERIKKGRWVKIFITLYIFGSVYLFANYFMRNFNEGVRFYEQDVQDVAFYVKSNTNFGDRVFVMNYWDSIYALTNTLPATRPWVPQLSWYLTIPGIQDKMVQSLKDNPPKLIIFNLYTSTGLSSFVPQKIYDFVTENYKISQRIGELEVFMPKN